jgi:hypothetical protein
VDGIGLKDLLIIDPNDWMVVKGGIEGNYCREI